MSLVGQKRRLQLCRCQLDRTFFPFMRCRAETASVCTPPLEAALSPRCRGRWSVARVSMSLPRRQGTVPCAICAPALGEGCGEG